MGIFDRIRRDKPSTAPDRPQTPSLAAPVVPVPTQPSSPTPHTTVPKGPANESRLDMGGTVSVSDEDKYQGALASAFDGAAGDFLRTFSTLHLTPGNPHAKNPDVPVIEVRIREQTVGYFTPAMTKRYLPHLHAAEANGRVLTATTVVDRNPNRRQGPPIEVSLLAVPRLVTQRDIRGLDVEVSDAHVVHPRTRTRHLAGQHTADGWITSCGRTIGGADLLLVRRTKPYVGWVDEAGAIVDDPGDACQQCDSAPAGAGRPKSSRTASEVPEPGRYGKQTDVTGRGRGRTESVQPNDAIIAALASGFEFDVAGESFRPGYPENLLQLARVLNETTGPEWVAAVLIRDASNEYDRNAIEVHVPSAGVGHVGFVPAHIAEHLAPVIDSGTPVWASAVEVRIGSGGDAKPGLTVCAYTRSPESN